MVQSQQFPEGFKPIALRKKGRTFTFEVTPPNKKEIKKEVNEKCRVALEKFVANLERLEEDFDETIYTSISKQIIEPFRALTKASTLTLDGDEFIDLYKIVRREYNYKTARYKSFGVTLDTLDLGPFEDKNASNFYPAPFKPRP